MVVVQDGRGWGMLLEGCSNKMAHYGDTEAPQHYFDAHQHPTLLPKDICHVRFPVWVLHGPFSEQPLRVT